MIQINKQGNAIVIEFTDNDKYLFDGTIEIAPNELMVVVDESNMATFKRVSNGDTLFAQRVEDIQINGIVAAKDTVIDLFGSIGYTSGGGGGAAGAVSSVNGQTGDVVITAAGIGAMTRAQADAAYQAKGEYATQSELEEKLEVFQVNAPMAFSRDEATQDLHLSIDLSNLATKEELNDKQDTLVSGTNIKTVNNLSILGEGNIEITGGSSATVYNCTSYETLNSDNPSTYIDGLTSDAPYKVGDIIHVTYSMGMPDTDPYWDLEIVGIYNYHNGSMWSKQLILNSLSDRFTSMYINTDNVNNINKFLITQSNSYSTNINEDLGTDQKTFIITDGIVYNYYNLKNGDYIEFTRNVEDALGIPSQKSWKLQVISLVNDAGNQKWILSGLNNVYSYTLTFGYNLTGQIGTLTANFSEDITVDADLSLDSANPVENRIVTAALNNKQATLVSGDNIKTINGNSILGAGNIEITAGGGTIAIDGELSDTSENPVQNKVINNALNTKANLEDLAAKQDTLVSGTNIKTINGASILGEGNIDITGGSGSKTYEVTLMLRLYEIGLDSSSTFPISGLNPSEPKVGDIIHFQCMEAGVSWEWNMQIIGIEDEHDSMTMGPISYYYLICPELKSAFKIKCSDPTNLIQFPLMKLQSGSDIRTINGLSIVGAGDITISAGEEIHLIGNLNGITEQGTTLSSDPMYMTSWDTSKLKIGNTLHILNESKDTYWNLEIIGSSGAMASENIYYLSGNDSNKQGYKILFSDINKIYPISSESITVDTTLNAESENPVQNKVINAALIAKADGSTVEALSTEVATVSTNVANLTTKVNEDSDKIASLDTEMGNKQNTLVSGTNIKTINGNSILGEGNIETPTVTVDAELSTESENPVQNKIITAALNGKQAAGDYALKSEIPDTSSLATKTELNNVSQEVEHKADKTSVYTMDEVNTKLATKQATLVAGANITLSDPDTEGKVTITATQPDISGITTTVEELTGEVATLSTDKQDNLVSGTNIKTINGESILGSGDITTDKIYEIYQNVNVGGDATKLAVNKEIYDLLQSGVYPRIYVSDDIEGKNKNKYFATYVQINSTSGNITIYFSNVGTNNKGSLTYTYYILLEATGRASLLSSRSMNYVVGVTGNYIAKNSSGLVSVAQTNVADATATGTGLADAYDVKQYVDSHSSSVTVDTEMSDTSENAVQNKVIKAYIDSLVGNILTQLQEINGTV